MTLYFWASLMLQVYRKRAYNSALFTYMYESGPGLLVVILRLVLLGWLWYALYTTHGNFPKKRGFYNKFGALFTAYLVALPVLVAVTGQMSETYRQIFSEAWSVALLLFAQLVFLMLYNPYWRANKSFPFHAQTPQDLGIVAEIARATEAPQALSGQGVGGVTLAPATMDGTRGQIYNAAARMSGVMAALGQVRYTMDCAIQDWQNELRHADDEDEYEDVREPGYRGGAPGPGPPSTPAGYGGHTGPPSGPPPGRRSRMGFGGGDGAPARPGTAPARGGRGTGWASSIFDDGNRRGAPPPQRGPPPDSWQASQSAPRGGGVGGGAGWREPEGRGREEARPLSAGPAPGGGGFGMEMAPRGDPKANEW